MSKILKDEELLDILSKVLKGNEIDCTDSYEAFLEDLSDVLCDHLGGQRGSVDFCEELGWAVAVSVDDSVPSDGGVWKHYDRDITWLNGVETS